MIIKMETNKRNTSKEKKKRNKGFPYKKLRKIQEYINKRTKINYKIVDDGGKVYAEFRSLRNARKELNRLKREFWLDNLSIECI